MARKKKSTVQQSSSRNTRDGGFPAPDKTIPATTPRPTPSAQIEVLEERVMFSADPFGLYPNEWAADTTLDGANDQTFWPGEPEHTTELIFVDSSVPQGQLLIDDLQQQINNGRSAVIILLQPDEDGLSTITEAINKNSALSAIHILSHGSDQGIQIGDTWLTNEVAQENATLLNQWQSALTDSADLLIYGCNLAASNAGIALLDTLARETQADVAASVDSTGHDNLGADWTLEFASGPIASDIHLSEAAKLNWEYELAATLLDAKDDSLAPVAQNTSLVLGDSPAIADADLTDNDVIVPINHDISLINVISVANGTVTENPDDTFTFTPDTDYQGPASVDYIVSDGGNDLIHHWLLDDNTNGVAVDETGRSNGAVSGATVIASTPSYFEFSELDGVRDEILLPPVDFPDSFTLSFQFRLDENGRNEDEQFLEIGIATRFGAASGSIGVWYDGVDGVIRTSLNGAGDTLAFGGFQTDILANPLFNSSATNNWYTYTLTIDNTSTTPGADVYIDGVHIEGGENGNGGFNFDSILLANSLAPEFELFEHHMRDFRIYEGVKVPTDANDYLHEPVRYSDATANFTVLPTINSIDTPDITLNVPAILTLTEDTTVAVAPSINVSHSLDPNTEIRATVEAENGTLNVPGATTIVAGLDTNRLIITGTLAEVNTTLDLLEYTADPHYHGPDTLAVNIDAQKITDVQDIEWQQSNSTQQPIFPQTLVNDPDRGEVLELRNGDYLEHFPIVETQEISFSAWVNLDSVGTSGAELFSVGNNVGLRLDHEATGATGFFRNAPAGTWLETNSTAILEGKDWQHIAYVITDGQQGIYINGVEVATSYYSSYDILDGVGAPQPLIDYSTGTLTRIGAHTYNSNTQFQFDGLIADAAIHARALSTDEIQAMAASASYAGEVSTTQLTISAVNDAPALSINNSTVSTTTITIDESTTPQNKVLEPDIEIDDIEAGFSGNYNQAILTLERVNTSPDGEPGRPSGANSDDRYSSNLQASFGNLATGTNLPFATVLKNSDGTLQIQFNSNATKTDIDTLMRSITYSNLDPWPPSLVELTWTFNDQGNDNYGNTDTAATLTSSITTTVHINAINQPPVVSTNNVFILESGGSGVINSVLLETTDPDSLASDLTYRVTSNPAGKLYLNGLEVNVENQKHTTFSQQDIDDGKLTYVAQYGPPGARDSFAFTVDDGQGGSVSSIDFNIELALDATQELLVLDDRPNGHLIAIINTATSSASGHTFTIDNPTYDGPFVIGVSNGEVTVADETKLNFTVQELHTIPIKVVSNDNGSVVFSETLNIRIVNRNESPEIASTNTQATLYIENTPQVIIDDSIIVTDEELDTYNNYNGVSLTLQRYDAVTSVPATNADDAYLSTGKLSALNEGFTFSYDGNIIGQATKNSGGELKLAFNQPTTKTEINGTLQSIAYRNNSDTPTQKNNSSELVDFIWTLDDGNLNTGANPQGPTDNAGGDNLTTIYVSTLNLQPVNDAPASIDKTLTTNEDTAITLKSTDFGFSDSIEGDLFAAVTIATLPANGTLTLAGAPVTNNQSISITNINGGDLVFTPIANENGSAYADFNFQVRDNGGTANGGIDQDQTANTITFNVNSSNDAPYSADSSISIIESESYQFSATDFEFNDIDGNALQSITITRTPANGTLSLNGASVALGQTITAVNSSNLDFSPAPGEYRDGYDSFAFTIQDDGGTANDGADTDPIENRINIDVRRFNDAPTASDAVITGNEDNVMFFDANDFGFVDVDGDDFQSVIIDSITLTGELKLYNQPVNVGQVISASELHNLTFTPPLNANGRPQGSFDFRVQDNGGVLNNGQNTSQTPNTITINLNPVNDSPNGADNTITVAEDTTYHFTTTDFTFNDIDGNQLNSLQITQLPLNGQLALNGTNIFLNQIVPAAQINLLSFTLEQDANRTGYDSFGFLVRDDGGTLYGGSDTDNTENFININVTSVNDTPSGTDFESSILEDTSYTFSVADFGFSDRDNNNLQNVFIDTLPLAGLLTHNGSMVSVGQSIPAIDLSALEFTPTTNDSGTNYAAFNFRVQDDGGTVNGGTDTDLTSNKVVIHVLEVSDAPTGANNTVSTFEDTAFTFNTSDFGFTDPDGDVFASVTLVSLPTSGTLQLAGNPVTDGQIIPAGNLGNLVYRPPANANGGAFETFSFLVSDNGGTLNGGSDTSILESTLSINVEAVNDSPQGSDNQILLNEDLNHTFSISDFGYQDNDDLHADVNSSNAADDFLSLTIDSLPATGSLLLSGNRVSAGQSIDATDIANGQLTFSPSPNTTIPVTTTFTVKDNGGTVNGGEDADPTSNTIDISFISINDAPTAADKTISIDEDSSYVLNISDFGFNDSNDNNAFTAVIVLGVPLNGSLQLAGVNVESNSVINTQDTLSGDLTYTPQSDAHGTSFDEIVFNVMDDGGTENQGDNTSIDANVLTFNINSINDEPAGTNYSTSTPEDTLYTLSRADFGFSDSDGDNLSAIAIVTLPEHGSLRLGNSPLASSAVITVSDIDTGLLTFTPDPNEDSQNTSGADYANFTFAVQDDGGTASGGVDTDQSPNTWSVDVDPVNDEPSGTNTTISLNEDDTRIISSSEFGFSDNEDSDQLSAVIITTLPASGSLLLSGQKIATGQTISAVEIENGYLTYTPPANQTGNHFDQIGFQVQDSGDTSNNGINIDQTPNLLTIDVLPVNDAPVAVNNEIFTLEDTPYELTLQDFQFSDIENDSVHSVRFDSLPADGRLLLNNLAVNTGEEITANSISSGDLQFIPDQNFNGNTQLEFTLRDTGGRDNQGFDQDPETNTLLFTVQPVNDAPVNIDTTATIADNLNYTLSIADFDFEDKEKHSLLAVRIDALPSFGTLTLQGQPVSVGDAIDVDSISQGSLVYIPVQDSGIPTSTFQYSVIDSGGTENGSQNIAQQAGDLTFDIESINDAPVANPDVLRVAEGQSTTRTIDNIPSLLSNDIDVEEDTLTANLVKAPDHGVFELFANGTFRYTHDGSETVVDEVTYSVTDGSATAETTVMINITPVNDAPIAGVVGDAVTTVSDEFTLTLPENHFIDPDDESLEITATLADGSPLPEWLVFNATTMTFSGSPTEAETLNITLTATDSQGLLAQSAFTVTVAPEPQFASAIEEPVIRTNEETPTEATFEEQPEIIVENEPLVSEDIPFQELPETTPDLVQTDATDNTLEIASFSSEAAIFRDFDLLSRSIETHRQFNVNSLTDGDSLIEVQENRSLADLFFNEDNQILNNSNLLNQLNAQREQMQQSFVLNGNVISGAVSVSTGLSIGYVIWLVRGGLLLGSVISSLPAWRNIDPLPILSTLNDDGEPEHDDSLEDLVEQERDTPNPEQGPDERQEN